MKSQKGFVVPLIIAIIAVLAIGVGGGVYVYKDKKVEAPVVIDTNSPTSTTTTPASNNPEPVFCTMDAMQCPDGSYVGRSGPKCEFICPAASSSPAKLFLEKLLSDFKLDLEIKPVKNTVNVIRNITGTSERDGDILSRELDGYIVVSTAPIASQDYYLANSFVRDWLNSGDATFRGSEGFKNDQIICVDSVCYSGSENDFAPCPEVVSGNSSRLFCADLNQ